MADCSISTADGGGVLLSKFRSSSPLSQSMNAVKQ